MEDDALYSGEFFQQRFDNAKSLLDDSYTANAIGHRQVVYKTPGSITLLYAANITFNADKFIHLGGVALDFDTGSRNISILNNTFTDISSTAIEIGGYTPHDMRPDSAYVTSNNLIENNAISYTGQDCHDAAGILAAFTPGAVITHNAISHTPWSAIAIERIVPRALRKDS